MGNRWFTGTVSDEMELLPKYFEDTDTYGHLRNFLRSWRAEITKWEEALDYISKMWRSDVCTESDVDALYFKFGIPESPRFLDLHHRRKLLNSLARLFQEKGSLSTIKRAIRLVSDLQVSVYPVVTTDGAFTIGYSDVGYDVLGYSYDAETTESFIVGYSDVGDVDVNPLPLGREWVYTFIIDFPFQPTDDQLLACVWVTELLKKGVEHYVLQWPQPTTYWIVGWSSVAVDTIVGPVDWEVGFSVVGSAVVNGPDPTSPDDQFSPFTLDPDTWLPV